MWFLSWEVDKSYSTSSDALYFASVDEMKEKFLNLSFTEEERLFIERNIVHNDRMAVIDPRLFESLNLPDGVALKKIAYCSMYNKSNISPVYCYFLTEVSDEYSLGSTFTASMGYRGNIGNSYVDSVLKQWINKGGGYDMNGYLHIDETEYKGYPALRLMKISESEKTLGQTTVYWRYIVEKNGRTYYVSDKIVYADSTETEILSRVLDVTTMHMNCEYSYTITSPTEECVDNFFKYDPFTYVEIVE